MILEVALLKVRFGQGKAFEGAFASAQPILSSTPGYVSHKLQRCIEEPEKYLLLVQWRRLEDHTIGFRQSRQYQDWKRLLHHFYDPFPAVEHFEMVFEGGRREWALFSVLAAAKVQIDSVASMPRIVPSREGTGAV